MTFIMPSTQVLTTPGESTATAMPSCCTSIAMLRRIMFSAKF
jgi:hypothetical protein